MTHARRFFLALLSLGCWGVGTSSTVGGDLYQREAAASDPVVMPKPAEVHGLAVYPTSVVLRGSDAAQQLIVTASLSGGRVQDLSGDVAYEVADAKVARL